MTEAEMVLNSINKLPGKVYTEVPMFSGSCDVVFIVNDEINAVEFKLKDWKRAIDQASRHKLIAEKCWVCLLVVSEKAKEYAKIKGVGILEYSEKMQPIIEAKKNLTWEPEKKRVLKYLEA
jgi:predicted P-loop ATPase/GTPase